MKSRYILPLLLLAAFALWTHPLDHESLWRDEVDTIRFASRSWEPIQKHHSGVELIKDWASQLTHIGENGPLYFWTMGIWLRVVGQTEVALRLSSTFSAVVAIALMFTVGKTIFSSRVGFIASTLLAVNPYVSWYAGEGKMYTLILCLVLLSTLLLMRALRSRRIWYWGAYLLVTSAMFYIHILTPLLVPVHVVLILLLNRRDSFSWRPWIAIGMLILPYLPLLVWQWQAVVTPAETGFPFVSLQEIMDRLTSVFSAGIAGSNNNYPVILFGCLAAVGIARPIFRSGINKRNRRGRTSLFLFIWAFIPVILLYLISFNRPLFTERYLIWTLPAWLLLISTGLVMLYQLGKGWRWLSLVLISVLSIVGLSKTVEQWTVPVRADFRQASALIERGYRQNQLIMFQIPYLKATFDYYTPNLTYNANDGPYTNYGDSEELVSHHLDQITSGYSQIWLILSESEMWDKRGLTLAWFQENAQPVQQHDLHRVQVFLWEMNEP